jgi:hypothetical protein
MKILGDRRIHWINIDYLSLVQFFTASGSGRLF